MQVTYQSKLSRGASSKWVLGKTDVGFRRLFDGLIVFRPRYLSISSNACLSKSWQKSLATLREGLFLEAFDVCTRVFTR